MDANFPEYDIGNYRLYRHAGIVIRSAGHSDPTNNKAMSKADITMSISPIVQWTTSNAISSRLALLCVEVSGSRATFQREFKPTVTLRYLSES